MRYLMGPGRFNEHTEQRVVASWDGAPEMHQPPRLGDGFDVRALVAELADPAVAAGIAQREPARVAGRKVPRGPVWHCSLRNHADDPVLTDAQWAEVVEDLMDRTGIARRGDAGACRWVAVRHAEDHVHVAAVLVRQDTGRKVYPYNDWARAREVCRDAEVRLGLTPTTAADRTAAEPVSHAELAKAELRGDIEPSRPWLRRVVRVAAVQAQDPQAFFRRLADLDVLVRPTEVDGQLVGYAVAARDDVNGDGLPVWFSGRRLARDLSLPKLLARWASAPPPAPPIAPDPGERARVGRAERAAAVAEATEAVTVATAAVRTGAADFVHGVAHAAGDLLTALAAVSSTTPGARARWELDLRGAVDLRGAAEVFDRAARTPHLGQPNTWAAVASQLRSAAWRLVAVGALTGRRGTESGTGELALALAALVAEIAAYHHARSCLAQAAAARRSAGMLREVGTAGARPARPTFGGPRRDQRGPGRHVSTPPPRVRRANRDDQGRSR